MKRFALLLLVMFLMGCSQPQVIIGPYASDAFRDKFDNYTKMYDFLLYADNGIGMEVDNYYQSIYPTGVANYTLTYTLNDNQSTLEMLQDLESFPSQEPLMENLDDSVSSVMEAVSGILDTLSLLSDKLSVSGERDVAEIQELDFRLSEQIEAANQGLFAMADEIGVIRVELNRQLIAKYELEDQKLAAELSRTLVHLNQMSESIDHYLDGQRVDMATFEEDVKAVNDQIRVIELLSGKAANLTQLGISEDELIALLDYLYDAKPVLDDMKEVFGQSKELDQTTIAAFDQVYFGFMYEVEAILP